MADDEPKSGTLDEEDERRNMLGIFRDESGKNEDWNKKYIHGSLFLLGTGAFGSVFQVTTRLYTQGKQKLAKERYVYHPLFLKTVALQRKVKVEQVDKIRDKTRDDRLLDIVAIKYEILEQSQLEEGTTRFFLFLRREFLVMDAIWRKNPKLLVGFPVVFDYGYIGDRNQYGVNAKYKNIFTYLNTAGEEVKFFADTQNRNLEGVTKISYMSMELLGPSIDDFRNYFEPWYTSAGIKPFFNVRTVFKLADQFLCRLYVMHRQGFVHHDLKPDNIALGNGRCINTIYLLDFGFSKQVTNFSPPEWMGSRKYISIDTFNGEKVNYAQDIESFFYVVMSLLYDALPWSEEFLQTRNDQNLDENAKWNLVMSIKKSWWEDFKDAKSLHEMITDMAQLHKHEVPDLKNILEQLHKKTRDLRGMMRQCDDQQTLNGDLCNMQSPVSRGYMAIRKVLLQIFDLPNITSNPLLGDVEFKSYQEVRTGHNHKFYPWTSETYNWEWDQNHAKLTNSQHENTEGGADNNDPYSLMKFNADDAAGIAAKRSDEMGNNNIFSNHRFFYNTDNNNDPTTETVRNRILRKLLVLGGKKSQRADEVSYVYNREANTLIAKNTGKKHIFRGNCVVKDNFGDTLVINSHGQVDKKSEDFPFFQ